MNAVDRMADAIATDPAHPWPKTAWQDRAEVSRDFYRRWARRVLAKTSQNELELNEGGRDGEQGTAVH